MNADCVENIRVGCGENLRHGAARRQAGGENPILPDAEFAHERLREASELGRFSRPSVLVPLVKPIPAAGSVRAAPRAP